MSRTVAPSKKCHKFRNNPDIVHNHTLQAAGYDHVVNLQVNSLWLHMPLSHVQFVLSRVCPGFDPLLSTDFGELLVWR